MSAGRREHIRQLLIDELREDDTLDDAEVVTTWICLIATYNVDDDGDNGGGVYVVNAAPEPARHEQLGMLHDRLLILEALTHEAARRALGDEE